MIYIKGFIAILWATLNAVPGILPSRIDYPWDGTAATQRSQTSYIDFWAGPQSISAGAHVTDSGWIDFTNVGRPFCQVEVEALGNGNREVEVVIEYATWLHSQLQVVSRTRQTIAGDVDYNPKTVIWNVPIDKRLGVIARVKWIFNKGDMDIIVQCYAPASGQPVADNTVVIDVEVVENV
ncbi:hypothetical protein LCGC14_0578310 [marine sediment metagenome]|uniref:Uncharacterized protein n=1 Tax=marine sediment metagenome TaxID=412755 RepID=A0A0F9RH96_9ZZZZ